MTRPPREPDPISAGEARRVALAAQGFADPRPVGRVDARHARKALAQAGIVQIDSVNMLVRSHELPIFSRIGPYPRELLYRLAYRDKELFEYWGHEASYLPMELHPLLRWRMARAHTQAWRRMVRLGQERPELVEAVLAEVTERGPVAARGLSTRERGQGAWWGWSDTKTALEWLFWRGEVAAAGRGRNFERLYDLTERVIPAAVLDRPTPDEVDANREMLRFAAARLGVATAGDLADFWRFRMGRTRPRLAELVEEGALLPVRVEGWSEPAYLDAAALRSASSASLTRRRVRVGGSLLSPFDSLVWTRPRVERLFGMRLRLEIFTPAPKRVHGYYVLPFLLDDQLVARVDLEADRKAAVLRVLASHAESPAPADYIAGPLAGELATLAAWLGLGEVAVSPAGDLAPALAAAAG